MALLAVALVLAISGAFAGKLTGEAMRPGTLMPKLGAGVPQMSAMTTIGPDLSAPPYPGALAPWPWPVVPDYTGTALRSSEGTIVGVTESVVDDDLGYPAKVRFNLSQTPGVIGPLVTLAAATLQYDEEKDILTTGLSLVNLQGMATEQGRAAAPH